MKDFSNWCAICGKWKGICSHGIPLHIKDMLGNTLKVGSVIAYPGRAGSSLWVTCAIIRGETPATTEKVATLQVWMSSRQKDSTLVSSEIYCIERVLRIHPEDYNDGIRWMVKEFWTNKYDPKGKKCTT